MIVTIWRHGEAANTAPDENRRLTPAGQDALKRAAAQFVDFLAKSGLSAPREIFHSPLTRTTETALILADHLKVDATVYAGLAPEASTPQGMIKWLDQQQGEHQFLVGHQPFVSSLIWYFLDDHALPPCCRAGMRPSSYPILSGALDQLFEAAPIRCSVRHPEGPFGQVVRS